MNAAGMFNGLMITGSYQDELPHSSSPFDSHSTQGMRLLTSVMLFKYLLIYD